ncbi:MAG: replication initiation protein [Desulforhopalus sp.]
MAAKQLPLPGTIVKKSNILCRARWGVESVYEPRLVALIAARVHKDDTDFQTYVISVKDLMTDTNDGGKAYSIIETTCRALMSRVIELREQGSRSFALYNVFSKCSYDDKTKTITARFDPDLKPHYLGLKAKFTSYNLIEYLLLSSKYSQRIFEFLKSWGDQAETVIDLSDLHEMLDVPDSLKTNFKDFRRRVLNTAHKDITRKTTFSYEWEPLAKGGEPIKRGRAVVAIRFIFAKIRAEEAQVKAKKEKDNASYNDNVEISKTAFECHDQDPTKCKQHQKKAVCDFCKSFFGDAK